MSWQPGVALTFTITGTTQFKGLFLAALTPGSVKTGTWTYPSGYSIVGTPGACPSSLTQTAATLKGPTVSFTWTAPSTAGLGTLTFRATMVVSGAAYYQIQATIPEARELLLFFFYFKLCVCAYPARSHAMGL